jgi:hypothetical protein
VLFPLSLGGDCIKMIVHTCHSHRYFDILCVLRRLTESSSFSVLDKSLFVFAVVYAGVRFFWNLLMYIDCD